MENTYKQLGAIFVKTLELAKGGAVRDMDKCLLEFYNDMETAPFNKELRKSGGVDAKLFREFTFEGGITRKTVRGKTATSQTRAMAALKKWVVNHGWKEGNRVKIGGVEYIVGGETSAEKNVGRLSLMLMWAYIGWAQHYSEMIGLDKDEASCPLSHKYRGILREQSTTLFFLTATNSTIAIVKTSSENSSENIN